MMEVFRKSSGVLIISTDLYQYIWLQDKIIIYYNKIMKKYDHEDDEEPVAKDKSFQKKDVQKERLQYLENDFHFAKIQSEINEIHYQFKSQDSAIKKMNKDLESKVNQALLIETIALINLGIHTDPNIMKLLKTREDLSEKQQQDNQLKLNSHLFARKLNQMSECLTLLLGNIKKVESRVNLVQADINSQMSERFNNVSIQMDDLKSDTTKEFMEMQQKTELSTFQMTDKLREIDTKLNWRLSQFKSRIDQKMSEELVKIYLQNMQKKLQKDMRQFQVKSNIDPERIDRIQLQMNKNRLKAEDGITENKFKIEAIKDQIQNELVRSDRYDQQKFNIETRLNLFNSNFTDVYTRVKHCEQLEIGLQENITKLLVDNDFSIKQLKRINTVLVNLRIGEDFQKMLQQMNPTKVLQLQDAVEEVKSEQTNIFRQIALAKRQMDTIQAKSEVMGFLQPNKERERLKKVQIDEALNNFLVQNQFGQKISNMDKQLNEYKLSVDAISLLTRQVARLQKESDFTKLTMEVKGLQEWFKRQLTLINNRIKQANVNAQLNASSERMLNMNPHISEGIVGNESLGGKSFSVKKMTSAKDLSISRKLNSQINRQINQLKLSSKN